MSFSVRTVPCVFLSFGSNTTNFTALDQLFVDNPQISYWKFEAVYSFPTTISRSALNFIVNEPPVNGSCSISPQNGTTSTVFHISCSDWFDDDGIKDYSVYSWQSDRSSLLMIAFSSVSNIDMRLPPGENTNTSLVHLIVHIRDKFDCVTEYNLSSVVVRIDTTDVNKLSDPIIRSLASGNQNVVGQILISLSQVFNEMNRESIKKAVSDGVSAMHISISSLESESLQQNSTSFNQSALVDFKNQLNTRADIREYLISFTKDLLITSSDSIKLQGSMFVLLTRATNELTRSSAMIASNKCYHLAETLYSMARRIPYEDVQFAASQITECAANVMNAVNGPLQQRTLVLDSDFSQANSFPSDYDTDLESAWSNPNMFADGNDFSSETIDKNRNIYYQKQTATEIAEQVRETISLISYALNLHMNIGQNLTITSPSVFMQLETLSSNSLSNKLISQIENVQIQMPLTFNSTLNDNQIISLRSFVQPLASADQSNSQSYTNLSRSVSLTFVNQTGHEISIETTFDDPIELIIPRDPNLIILPMNLQDVRSANSMPHNQLFHLQYLNITSSLAISLHFEVHPLNHTAGYLFVYKFDQIPQLNSSINNTDGWSLFCPANMTNDSIYKYWIDSQKTVGHRSIIFGLRQLNSTEITSICTNSSITNPPITNQRFEFTSNYELRVYTSGCYYLNASNHWQSDGLVVGPLTNHYQTQCLSNHLTTFANGFIVLPSPINWNYVFTHADFLRNITIYLTVICACITYITLIIYARFQDKKDVEKLCMRPLVDNHRSDEYLYQIVVFTGHRANAGTESKVHFIISGDNDDTPVRTFSNQNRRVFQRGGIDAFLMAVPKSLGLLNYVRIWHDNSGGSGSASWFLKYIIVRDLQTMETFHFICQRWLAVEKDDGKVERILFTASNVEKQEFSYVLSKQTYEKLSDGHLWFSIFFRSPSNKFTRVQRCTCCFVLLFISMLLNIMYYDLSDETSNTIGLSIGVLRINSQQIVIGVMTELLALLPSLLVVQLFQRLRSREEKSKRPKWTLAWWWIFIAYGVCFLLVGVSIFFTIARGIEFGDSKAQKWLISILTGFFSSILLTQPMKVLCLAIFFTRIVRKRNTDEEASEYMGVDAVQLMNDGEYNDISKEKSTHVHRYTIHFDRLSENDVARARLQRTKEVYMWSIIREVLTSIGFLIILCFFTYSNHDQNSFFQVNHLRKLFLNSRQIDNAYTQITTIEQYWSWLETSFASNLRAQQWYNDDQPYFLNGFVNDKSNRLIGWAIMRQLRVKSNLCSNQKLIDVCAYDYNFWNEEKRSFGVEWKNETNGRSNSSIDQAFQYRSGEEYGYVYEFHGRLSDLQNNLSKLHELEWIDNRTRIIIIQMSLYNPNSQLFTSVTLRTEFLSTGTIVPQYRFEPFNFNLAFGSASQLVCVILYVIFIVYLTFNETKSLIRTKLAYVRQFWCYVEVGIIACSWTSVGIYVWRYKEAKRIGHLFAETNGYVYINFQSAVYVNDVLSFLFGFCCFFGTVKFVRLCRFSQRLSLFTETVKNVFRELISFSLMFSIVFLGFLSLYYLLFISTISSCANVLKTSQMLFEMTLMKFDTSELMEAHVVLGPLCFSLFIFFVVFVCLSMFITIINDGFRRAQQNLLQKDDEMVLFMWTKFQRWIGWSKSCEERNNTMEIDYLDLAGAFPKKVDKLLHALNRVYIDQQTSNFL
ncbi:unnamed protein product [Adineta ricciae]|uniref:PLAT domain-containing protein n=1 Tax=Adineta ricciae TaxID=249248 RepID=A0A815SJJ9_ADIRI|nr:unnamed protein product [Adineta ricciae]